MDMQDSGRLVMIDKVSVKLNGRSILNEIDLAIRRGEQWAVVGASGSGKTSLGHALIGRNFYTGHIAFDFPTPDDTAHRIVMVEQQHHFKNLSNTDNFYYQQRFNSMDAEDSITVRQYLQDYIDNEKTSEALLEQLHVTAILQKPLIQLSNGENKRLQLAAALLKKPEFLVLDNPFTGLDKDGRKVLHDIIGSVVRSGIHVLLITTPQELPVYITHVAVLRDGRLVFAGVKKDYTPLLLSTSPALPVFDLSLFNELFTPPKRDFDSVIRMINVSVQYGERTILNGINWEVKKGERWNISGPNGAGKSTLLSLVNGDNPQAYANEIYLFDRRRGSGESIWDIKQKIGYVSPELHLFFDSSNSCSEVIASGLFDTIGLFRQLNEIQQAQVSAMLTLLHLDSIQHKRLFQLSLGQQRMVLLARALIKNPPLLILDEPCQGLDDDQAGSIKTLVDTICLNTDTTLLYVSHYERDIPSCVTGFLKLG